MAKSNKIKMKLASKANFIIFLVLQAITLVSYSQPLQKITAPEQYANSVVIVIPENRLNVDLTGKKTKVHLYVVTIDSGQLTSIVNRNKLITGHKKFKAEVHVRGDATMQDPKKQFEVKLHHPDDDQVNFLNMPKKGKDWVFNDCGAVDQTLLRNVITFSNQSALKQYSPQWKWFELFICDSTSSIDNMSAILKNHYWGLYLNFDKIMFSPERINAPYDSGKQKKEAIYRDYAIIQLNQENSEKYLPLPMDGSQPIALTAGVQVYEPKLSFFEEMCKIFNVPCASGKATCKSDSTTCVKDSTLIMNTINNWYYTTSGTSKDNWAGQMNSFYTNYILNTTDTSGRSAALKSIRSITDYTSFAIYFVLNEISKDPDGYHKSTFMVKQKNICFAGPLWDKNKSYGNLANNPSPTFFYNLTKGWLYYDSTNTINQAQSPVWWHVLLADSMFCNQVWKTWKAAYKTKGGVLRYEQYDAMIQAQLNFINKPYDIAKAKTSALIRNNACWPNGYSQTMKLYNGQVEELKKYLKGRLLWMDANLPALLKSTSGFNTY